MDPDPFSVWATPDPIESLSTSTDGHKPPSLQPRSRDLFDTAQDGPQLAFDRVDQDDDPGWGAPLPAISANGTGLTDSAQVTPAHAEQTANGSSSALSPPSATSQELDEEQDDFQDAAERTEAPAVEDAVTTSAPIASVPSSEEDLASQTPPAAGSSASASASAAVLTDTVAATTSPLTEEHGTDDFDDFDQPTAANDDDFGDFGDFDQGDAPADDFGAGDADDFDDEQEEPPTPRSAAPPPTTTTTTARTWSALAVSQGSTRDELLAPVQELLPVSVAAARDMSTDGLRQVEGMAQVLVSEQSRQLWKDLSALPPLRPVDWVRSRTRRDYLITMGVPVNLDEIHNSAMGSSSSSGSALPPLKLKLDSGVGRAAGPSSAPVDGGGVGLQRSSSAQVSGLGAAAGSASARSASASGSPRNGTQSPALGQSANRERLAERRREELGLGPPPDVDLKRAEVLVGQTEDRLALLSLPALRSMLRELHSLTTSTSSLLTHHLTIRESLQADAEMYNSMIKELVTGAASRIGASHGGSHGGSGGGGSGMYRSASLRGGAGADRRATTIGIGAGAIAQNRAAAGRLSSAGTASRNVSPSLRGGVASAARR